MSRVYALFVGINEYRAVSPLHGCVADVQSVHKLFAERVPEASQRFRMLLNSDATYTGIVSAFREHLGQAVAGDVALFYFCGHGSMEPCPAEWRAFEPSGYNQTLLPVDMHTPDVFGLADKELSALIQEVAAGGADVVVITDSCHSGGNTREDGGVARMAAADRRARTLNDYLASARELYAPDRVQQVGPPQPRHIAIAACEGFETAKEYPMEPPRRGVFTVCFEEAVRALGPSATYVDIVNTIALKVRGLAREQTPNLFVSGGARSTWRFLGGQTGRTDLTVTADSAGQWWLSAGVIDGVPAPESGDVTEVAIFARGAFDDVAVAPVPVATAVVVALESDRALLRVNHSASPLDVSRPYIAAITRLGTPSVHVSITEAETSDDGAVREAATQVRAQLTGSSPLFSVTTRSSSIVAVHVVVHAAFAEIVNDAGAPFEGLRFALNEAGLQALLGAVVHMARWHALLSLTPVQSRLNDSVRIELVPVLEHESAAPPGRAPHVATDGALALSYADTGAPRMQCQVRNTSSEKLFVTLLNLADTYECAPRFADWIPAGGVANVVGGHPFRLAIQSWRGETVASTTDYFKVVAAIESFEPDRWTLPPLLKPESERTNARGMEVDDPLKRERTAEGVDAFWGTSLLKVVTSRAQTAN